MEYEATGDSRGIEIIGNRAYVANSTEGLQILDITDPENIVLIKTVTTPTLVMDVATYGDYAYLAVSGTPNSVQVININESSVDYGLIVHVILTSDNAFGVEVSGLHERVYVSTYYSVGNFGMDIIPNEIRKTVPALFND